MLRSGLAIALVAGVTACSGGGRGTTATAGGGTAQATAQGTPTSATTSAPSTGPGTAAAGSSAPAGGSTAAESSTTAGGSAAATGAAYRVRYAPVTEKLPKGAGTITYPVVTVTGPDAAVRSAAQRVLRDRIRAVRDAFVADAGQLGMPGATTSQDDITLVRETRWDRLYAVRLLEDRYIGGAAHPVRQPLAVTIDWRTGAPLRAEAVFPRLAPVDAAVRTALRRAYADVDATGAADLTVGPGGGGSTPLESYPTPAGLWVGVPACVFVCALGPLEVTVPWSQLPAPRPGVLPGR